MLTAKRAGDSDVMVGNYRWRIPLSGQLQLLKWSDKIRRENKTIGIDDLVGVSG